MSPATTSTLYVTGKGGAGKSAIAQALAREAKSRGERVVLVDALEAGESGGDAEIGDDFPRVVLDPRSALRRLLGRLLRFEFLSTRLMESLTFSAVAAAAPGLSDLLRLDYLRELSDGRIDGRFDRIIVNAPASGHGIALLETPLRFAEIAARGPAAAVASAARAFVLDPGRLRVVVVALAEELAAAETAELHGQLARLRIAVTPTVVNGVYPAHANGVQESWLASHTGSFDARLYLARRARQLALTAETASPTGAAIVLPYRFGGDGIDAKDRARLFDGLTCERP